MFYVLKVNAYMFTNILPHPKFYSVRNVTSLATTAVRASILVSDVNDVVKTKQQAIIQGALFDVTTAVIVICQLILNVRLF